MKNYDPNLKLKYDINKEFGDYVIEDLSNSSINLRMISWNGRAEKLDIRGWGFIDGKEIPKKGITLTEKGANELASVLIEKGYGDTDRILKSLKQRSDFNPDVSDDSSEEFFDPTDLFGDDD